MEFQLLKLVEDTFESARTSRWQTKGCSSEVRTQNFHRNVLLKLDLVLDNQEEQLSLLQRMVSTKDFGETQEEIFSAQLDTAEQINSLCERLSNAPFKKSMVRYLSAIGGKSCGDTIRRMMRKLGSNKLWSLYSLKGKKGKHSFESTRLYMVVVRACMRTHSSIGIQESKVQDEVAEFLKHAPSKPGGSRYQKRNSDGNTSIKTTNRSNIFDADDSDED